MKNSNKVKIISMMVAGTLGTSFINQTALASHWWSRFTSQQANPLQSESAELSDSLYLEEAFQERNAYLFADAELKNVLLLDDEGNPCSFPVENGFFSKSLIDDDRCYILPTQLLLYLADQSTMDSQKKYYASIYEVLYSRLKERKAKLDSSFGSGNESVQHLMVLQDEQQDAVSVTLNWDTGRLLICANATMVSANDYVYRVKLPNTIYRKIVSRFDISQDDCVIYDWKSRAFKIVKWGVAMAAVAASVYGAHYAYQNADQWIPIVQQYYEAAAGKMSTFWESAKNFGGRAWEGAKNLPGRAWEGAKNLPGRARDFGGRAWEGAKDFGGRAWEGAKDFGGRAWESAKNFGGRAREGAKNFGGRAWEGTKKASGVAATAWPVVGLAGAVKQLWSGQGGKEGDAQNVPQTEPSVPVQGNNPQQ